VSLLDIRWHPQKLNYMKTPNSDRLIGTRKSVYANITHATHAKMQRHAPAAHLSSAKYAGVALEFYIALEESFGGPMTEQFRAILVRNASGVAAKLEKLLAGTALDGE